MRPKNRMTPEQAAEFRFKVGVTPRGRNFYGVENVDVELDRIATTLPVEPTKSKKSKQWLQGLAEPYRAPKKSKRAQAPLIDTRVMLNTETRCSLQIAAFVPSQIHVSKIAEWGIASRQRHAVWDALTNHLSWEADVRERVIGVTVVRVANLRLFEHDNLPWAMKYVVDAFSAYIEHGNAVLSWGKEEMRLIGRCDDNIIRTAETPWNRVRLRYAQEDCEWNSKLHGVRIHMTLLRRGQRWTPYTTHIARRRRRSARVFRTAHGFPSSDRS